MRYSVACLLRAPLDQSEERLESAIAAAAGRDYEFDGNEIGPDGWTLFLWSSKPGDTVGRLKQLAIRQRVSCERISVRVVDTTSPQSPPLVFPLDRIPAGIAMLASTTPRRLVSRLFDLYSVPLPDGRFGYVFYFARDLPTGDLVEAYSLKTDQPATPSEAELGTPLFLAHTSCLFGLRTDGWQRVANRRKVPAPEVPLMRYSRKAFDSFQAGIYDDWIVINADREARLVGSLSPDLQELHIRQILMNDAIARMIATDEDPRKLYR